MLRLASLLSLLAAGALGCADLSEVQLDTTTTEQAFIDCDPWICGSNSPIIDTYRFHELNIRGLANDQGFSVFSLWRAGIHYQLSVEHGRIIGRAGSLQIQGAALQGAQIRLRHNPTGRIFPVQIKGVGTVQTFARLGSTPRPLETYELEWAYMNGDAPPTGWRNLCSNIPARSSPDVLGMNTTHALVFEGERIDRDAKTIDITLDTTWFNIGCAGHALAKLAINGHTEAAKRAYGFQTTIPERQAFLKMLAGDYCGNGTVFTVAGQRLQWMDWHGYTQYTMAPANLALEARWGPGGAICLDTPRVDANPTQLGSFYFPQGAEKALDDNACGLQIPSCDEGPLSFGGATLVSANPL
ncbi:MAG TPA: ADYC domain-containing protein [Myxococcota bacterium]|nr:ADYC domain-containing protein [Myxococcota bacterium]